MLKKLYKLVLISFAGPFVMTFVVALFILVMQFLFKYLDDLVGKGLEWHIVLRLLMYASITLVPLALPLAILLSSIMTLGNFAENYELVACKSAGISLRKVMLPLVGAAILISIAAFIFSNNILPYANLKMSSLLYDVTNQRPALNIREGIFYNGIDGYVIRVGKKESDGQTIRDVMIYDHTNGAGNTKLTTAVSGKMVMSPDKQELIITLNNGNSYEEQSHRRGSKNDLPLVRSHFEKYVLRFNLSSFRMSRTDEGLFKNNYQMQNLSQLKHSTDTLAKEILRRKDDTYKRIEPFFSLTKKNRKLIPLPDTAKLADFYPVEKRSIVNTTALYSARNMKSIINDFLVDSEVKSRSMRRYLIEWHRKFSLSFACLILFFVGAPLGAIVRRGGIGLPVIFSVLLFLIYHVISISGEKFAREGVIAPWQGMWLSSAVLLPVGMFLTYKAITDSTLFHISDYFQRFNNFIRRKRILPAG
jgi:lipopolysaccharide export system permease protein